MRRAVLSDAARLCELFRRVRPLLPEAETDMEDWLEHGGALLMEDGDGRTLAALRWAEDGDGWRIDRLATLPEERSRGYGRWLMTKVEALAIRANVPTLSVELDDPSLLPYYGRMGYRQAAQGSNGTPGHAREPGAAPATTLRKRVGGVWQTKAGT